MRNELNNTDCHSLWNEVYGLSFKPLRMTLKVAYQFPKAVIMAPLVWILIWGPFASGLFDDTDTTLL